MDGLTSVATLEIMLYSLIVTCVYIFTIYYPFEWK